MEVHILQNFVLNIGDPYKFFSNSLECIVDKNLENYKCNKNLYLYNLILKII